jgi:hypothetical protein
LIYWHHCGDPDLVDSSILAELAAVTFGYWLFEILAARAAGAWWADPGAVFLAIYRTGPRALLVAAGPPAFAYLYLKVVLGGLAYLHVDGLIAFPRLAAATVGGVFAATFLLRVVGIWSYRGGPSRSDDDDSTLAKSESATDSKLDDGAQRPA